MSSGAFTHDAFRALHFADLTIAAIAYRRLPSYTLWVALRTHKTRRGYGYLENADVRTVARDLRFADTTLARALTAGENMFWTRGKTKTLHPYAPARVAVALGVPYFQGAFLEPKRTLRQRTRRSRLAVMAIATVRRGKPTSTETMARLLNVTPRSIQRYQRQGGLPIRENFLCVPDTTPKRDSIRVRFVRGRPVVVCQLPNSFPDVGVRGAHALLRRHNRQLRAMRAGQPSSEYPGKGNSRQRLYGSGRLRPDSDPSTPLYTLAGVLNRSGPLRDRRPVARLWTHTLPAKDEDIFSPTPGSGKNGSAPSFGGPPLPPTRLGSAACTTGKSRVTNLVGSFGGFGGSSR